MAKLPEWADEFLASIDGKVESRLDALLRSQAASPHTTRNVLIGVVLIIVGWDLLKMVLF